MKSLNVLHVSSPGPMTGAGRAALQLHLSLIQQGINSRILFLIQESIPYTESYSYGDTGVKKLKRFFHTTLDRFPTWLYPSRKRQIFSPGLNGINIESHSLFEWADVIHLHWINHGFISINQISKIKKPIFWTMHDMWVFTGGCHYSFSCERYMKLCGKCPVLHSNSSNDLSRKVLETKISSFSNKKITFIAISNWMKHVAMASALLKEQEIEVIYSGIDTNVFRPINQCHARKALNLPSDKKIILLGAQNLLSPSKGLSYSINALAQLSSEYLIVTFGHGKLESQLLRHKVINMGFVKDSDEMAHLYSAADLFLATSVAEAFGMTVAEAQCVGTPVVALNGTGPKDIIEDRVTGYLAEKNENDLIHGIHYCLSFDFNKEYISKRARDTFSIENCAKKYILCYSGIATTTQS